jgi:hypothetical protein
MLRAIAGNAARQDFATLGDKAAQFRSVFVIDMIDLIDAEAANLLAGTSAPVTSNQFLPLLRTLESERDIFI